MAVLCPCRVRSIRMSVKRTLVRNVFSNWVGFAVHALVGFLLTPFVVHQLGDRLYGVWTLLISVTGYYGLLDVGFRAGLTQYLARHLARRDYEQLNRTASTGLAALGVCGLVVLVVSWTLAAATPLVFDVTPELVENLRFGLATVGIMAAIQFIFFPFSAVFNATQRYDLANVIGVSTRLLGAALVVLALRLRPDAPFKGILLATSAANMVDYLARWRTAYRILPQLAPSYRLVNWKSAWEFTHFSIWNVLTAGSVRIISYTDAIVIGMFMPLAAVAPFSLATGLIEQFTSVFRPVATVFFPAFTHLDAAGERDRMRTLYLRSSRVMALMSLGCGLVAYTFAYDFFRLWIGPRFTDHADYTPVHELFRWLLAGAVVSNAQRIGYQLLMGAQQIRSLALMFVGEAVSNLVLSVILIQFYGLWGVAVGTLVPAVICQGVLLPVVVSWAAGVSAWHYFSFVAGRALLAGVAATPVLYLMHLTGSAAHWPGLITRGVVCTALVMVVMIAVGFDAVDRQRFVWEPTAKLRRKWARRRGVATGTVDSATPVEMHD